MTGISLSRVISSVIHIGMMNPLFRPFDLKAYLAALLEQQLPIN